MSRQYIMGDGKIGVEKGKCTITNDEVIYSYVALFPLLRPLNVGDDVKIERAKQSGESTYIVFKSVESIEIMERALAFAKKTLKKASQG